MMYSNADLFFDQKVTTATSEVLCNNYNRNWEDKAYLSVHANTTKAVKVELLTGSTEGTVATVVATWERAPNKDGYVVMDKLPRGLGKYMALKVTCDGETKVLAGIVLEQDLDYDWADRDPTAIFNGTKGEADIRAELQ